MKKTIYVAFLLLAAYACSTNETSITPNEEEEQEEVIIPVANNDSYTTPEGTELTITDLFENDENFSAKTDIEIIDTDLVGTIEDIRNYSYTYTPKAGFTGTDSFQYTLCNDAATPDCSTATVTITITDNGNPTATDDAVYTFVNSTKVFSNLTDNDFLVDDATITSVNTTSTTGTVVLENNGDITYTPQTDFVGDDTFTYTLCDSDSPTPSCATATVTVSVKQVEVISFNIPTEVANYYNNVVFTTDPSLLYDELQKLTTETHTNILEYTDRHDYLYDADLDPTNTANVLLMYTGESRDKREWTSGSNSHGTQTFNTEHVYPQSLFKGELVTADLHHLRVCDASTNTSRSNRKFVEGSGDAGIVSGEWYPGDEWKGDVARMIFFLNVRHSEIIETVGSLDTFLQWNEEDPISDFEIQRNNIIQGAQGNRNPFIDNPYLATLIWGGEDAENKWK